MADCFDPEKRSEVMSRIRSKGTAPERKAEELLRKWLPGFDIQVHPKEVFGQPDFFVPALGLAVFVDGCFFHGCPIHYREPKENVDYWKSKLKRNRKRDQLVRRTLAADGITVLRLWEHEMKGKGPSGRDRFRRRVRRVQKAAYVHRTGDVLMAAEDRVPYGDAQTAVPPIGESC